MKKLFMGALLLGSLSAHASIITVNQTSCTLGPACAAADAALQSFVDADLPSVGIGKYATGIANANGFTYAGMGSDYSDDFSLFMVRGAFGGSVSGDLDNPGGADGFGFGAATTVGVNLDLLPVDKIGPIDLSKMDLFVSFMSYSVDQDSGNSSFTGDTSHFGIMARYQLVDTKDILPGYMLEWGGVQLHTGFQRSSFDLNMSTRFDNQTVDIGPETGTFGNAGATFAIESSSTTIPIEVSTFLRAAYVFTFYAGAGFDIVSGSSDVGLVSSGTFTSTNYSADINAGETGSGDADATNFRAFGGFQFNIPLVRLYAHVNKGLGSDLIGAHFGAKFTW